ncbi:DEAD/DEAH box helicase family protein [Ottowia testudinis]|uniref:DEAD/DEAH box helicase family protein n=1 Tax=Ottowia testudinis TaxID=2816950 RepID=A0A975H496_9BURK|nr:DEAD/DEAH box helicase family protein [Ottowia testudinis]QTD46668.1 DEAD/DEAH box helicase family protein [Ottowia testudinis]
MSSHPQFQYTRLAYQAQAVRSVEQVFDDVRFIAPRDVHGNPTFAPHEAADTLRANIDGVRAANDVEAGTVSVPHTATPALQLDVLMETGTGKTFTFIETIHRLHQKFGLAKFIVLVPSNAIRQGTLRTLQTTAAFFAREYDNQKISVVNYSDKTVAGFIHAANRGISVMVATYQSFAGDSKLIHKRGVEANLFGRARSYMEALAAMRPVLIIDEPHRFEGRQTQEYLTRFNPLLTLRFGATFKRDEFTNLIYTLDSLEAFRQRLVKGITVDTVGTGSDMAETLTLLQVSGTAKEREALVRYQKADGKPATVALRAKTNLGEQTGLSWLDGHVVEKITKAELLFTNGLALPLEVPVGYGMLADEVQSMLIARAIGNHFEREEALFQRGVKAISLFFIDAVHKYLPDGQRPAVLRALFEQHYRAQLQAVLARDELDADYRAYLERSAGDVGRVHRGYFARSHSEKGEEEAIKLILQDKEKLLSFDTDLRFIFSMWALQEGWDNPNVFTLCKLAPSNSKITRLQQIGRGLRLAVNQQLERVPAEDAEFDAINDLTVVVPASEGDFVRAIQGEISAASVRRVSAVFDDGVLAQYGVALSTRQANRVLDALAAIGLIELDDLSGQATLLWPRQQYQAQRERILAALRAIANLPPNGGQNMLRYLDLYYEGAGQVKAKPDKKPPTLAVRGEQFEKFRGLWSSLNHDAVLRYELDSVQLVESVLSRIDAHFDIKPLAISVTRASQVHSVNEVRSEQAAYKVLPHSVFTLAGFVGELANGTRLSLHTVSDILRRMPAEKFALIARNENRALITLRELIIRCVHELVVNKVTYELREVRVQTALTDRAGQLLKTIPLALCGAETHDMANTAVREKSLYANPLMPVDSQIERDTVDESSLPQVTVFAKLPKVNIPTPLGNYNPDFGYVVAHGGKPTALYLVVETKGYDQYADIHDKERWKIESARHFFAALAARQVPVVFKTKLNGQSLAALVADLQPASGA